MHGAAERRVEQRGEPAAMHGSERVVVLELRPALEYRDAHVHANGYEVQRLADQRARQLAGEDRLQRLESRATAQLLGAHIPGRREPCTHRLLFCAPARERVFAHMTFSASSCKSFRMPESTRRAD